MVIQMISHDLNLWDYTSTTNLACPFWLSILTQFGALFSSTQGAERVNKDQNLSESNQREEAHTSKRMAANACINEIFR
jgi:hypothetical protein